MAQILVKIRTRMVIDFSRKRFKSKMIGLNRMVKIVICKTKLKIIDGDSWGKPIKGIKNCVLYKI